MGSVLRRAKEVGGRLRPCCREPADADELDETSAPRRHGSRRMPGHALHSKRPAPLLKAFWWRNRSLVRECQIISHAASVLLSGAYVYSSRKFSYQAPRQD